MKAGRVGVLLLLLLLISARTHTASGNPIRLPARLPTPRRGDSGGATHQPHFRLRSADHTGLNDDSGWAFPLDTAGTIDTGSPFRVRFEIENQGSSFSDPLKLQYRRRPLGGYFGAWLDVTRMDSGLSVTAVQIWPSPQFSDDDSTTDLLAGSGVPFVSGVGEWETQTPEIQLSDEHTEIEWPLLLNRSFGPGAQATEAVAGDEIELRVVRADGSVLDGSYNNPLITVQLGEYNLGGTYPETPGRQIVAYNGSLYTFIESNEFYPLLRLMKSSDSGRTWSLVDPGDEDGPGATERDAEAADLDLDGPILHIAQYDMNDDVIYYRVDLDAGEWIARETVEASAGPQFQSVALEARSDGTVVCFYNSGSTIRYRVRSPGGGWSSALELDDTSSTDHQGIMVAGGASDDIHIFYSDRTNGDLRWRRLDSSGNLSTSQLILSDLDTSPARMFEVTNAVYYDDDGVDVVAIGFRDHSDGNFYSRSLRDGVVQPRQQIAGAVISDGGGGGVLSATLGAAGKTLYAFYAPSSDGDVYFDTNIDGAGWSGTGASHLAGVHTIYLRGEVMSVEGIQVFGYVYEDDPQLGGTLGGWTGRIHYNQLILPEPPTPSPTHTPTPTATPSLTHTNTPLPTHTSTSSPTPTASPSPIPTDTSTSTLTPTYTNTPIPTFTITPSSTPTLTNTTSPTYTNTPFPTSTNTPSSTPTGTNTPTSTSTATVLPAMTEPAPSPTQDPEFRIFMPVVGNQGQVEVSPAGSGGWRILWDAFARWWRLNTAGFTSSGG